MKINYIIPLDIAGIGDAIAIADGANGENAGDFIAVLGNSCRTTPPAGYSWYGVVYGKERGGLMVAAHNIITSIPAATSPDQNVTVTLDATKHANVIDTTKSRGISRNGLEWGVDEGGALNLERIAALNVSSTSTQLHPTTPWRGSSLPMSKTAFDDDVSQAKTLYGTYFNYLAQMIPVTQGGKAGVMGVRCGKQNTKELAETPSAEGFFFSAAGYCYSYLVANENDNHWWLPDMYELGQYINHNTLPALMATAERIGGSVGDSLTNRWSCMRYNATNGWAVGSNGCTFVHQFGTPYSACPVTIIPLR